MRLSREFGYIEGQQALEQSDRALIEACGGKILRSHNVNTGTAINRVIEFAVTRRQWDQIQRLRSVGGGRYQRDSWWRY
jgi:hypothetical protein